MSFDPDYAAFAGEMRRLRAADLPDADKVAQMFGLISRAFTDRAFHDVELAAALGDKEEKVRAQIRLETARSVRRIFRDCHRQVTGREAWDDSEQR